MENNHTSSPYNLLKRLSKDTTPPTQLQTIFSYLQDNIATASMVSFETNIPRRNICRYKRDLEKAGLLYEIAKDHCVVTGHKAWYITADLGQSTI
ncbi:MAG: hypothetical protein K0B37_16195 [Bacteroidales bacterium]|nr:hypothetical protein [Bacteroidales bacterium]